MSTYVWDIHGVEYGSSDIGQITGQSVNRGIQRILGIGSGEVERQYTSVGRENPGGTFTTKAVNTALGIIGVNGAAIGTNDLILYRKRMEPGGTRSTGSVHDKITISDGIVFPAGLTIPDGDDAAVSYQWFGVDTNADGTSPVAVTVNQALSGTTNHDEGYRLGPLTINGTTVDNVQSVDVNFGIQVDFVQGDGTIFPRDCYIAQILPELTVTCFDSAVIALIGETGLDINNSTKVVVKLRQVNKNSAVSYAAGITLTITDGMVHLDGYQGTHGQKGGFSFRVVPTKDSGTDLIVLGTF